MPALPGLHPWQTWRLAFCTITDRFGGRLVFTLLTIFTAIPAHMVSQATTFFILFLITVGSFLWLHLVVLQMLKQAAPHLKGRFEHGPEELADRA